MSDKNQQQQQPRNSVYTNSSTNSYDKYFSAIEYKFVNNSGLLKFTPIEKAFVGKDPKKGDKIYNYEKSESLLVTAVEAIKLLNAITLLESTLGTDDQMASISVKSGGANISKNITIFAPGCVKFKSPLPTTTTGFTIKFERTTEKDGSAIYWHIFAPDSYVIRDRAKEETEIEIHAEFDLFKHFLKTVIDNATGVFEHGANRSHAVNNKGASSFRSGSRGNTDVQVVEDGDEDDTYKATSSTLEAENEFK